MRSRADLGSGIHGLGDCASGSGQKESGMALGHPFPGRQGSPERRLPDALRTFMGSSARDHPPWHPGPHACPCRLEGSLPPGQGGTSWLLWGSAQIAGFRTWLCGLLEQGSLRSAVLYVYAQNKLCCMFTPSASKLEQLVKTTVCPPPLCFLLLQHGGASA